jgi:SNF2 family DNA or RNA helicase
MNYGNQHAWNPQQVGRPIQYVSSSNSSSNMGSSTINANFIAALKEKTQQHQQGKIKVIPVGSALATDKPNGLTRINETSKFYTPVSLPSVSINEINIPTDIATRLFEHQIAGVEWLYAIHLAQRGAVLGDDMGLGKTFQVTTLITGLMRMKLVNRVLVLAPVSVLASWIREMEEHLVPYVKVKLFNDATVFGTDETILNTIVCSGQPSICSLRMSLRRREKP